MTDFALNVDAQKEKKKFPDKKGYKKSVPFLHGIQRKKIVHFRNSIFYKFLETAKILHFFGLCVYAKPKYFLLVQC